MGRVGVLEISGSGRVGCVGAGTVFAGSVRVGGATAGAGFVTDSCCAVDGGMGGITCSGCVFSRLGLLSEVVEAAAGDVFSRSICDGDGFVTGVFSGSEPGTDGAGDAAGAAGGAVPCCVGLFAFCGSVTKVTVKPCRTARPGQSTAAAAAQCWPHFP